MTKKSTIKSKRCQTWRKHMPREPITLIHKLKGQIPKAERENGKKIWTNNSHILKDQNDSQTWKNVHACSLLEKWKLKWPFFSCCCYLLSCIWLFVTPRTVATRFLCPWDSPDKNTEVGCHFLFQGIIPTEVCIGAFFITEPRRKPFLLLDWHKF